MDRIRVACFPSWHFRHQGLMHEHDLAFVAAAAFAGITHAAAGHHDRGPPPRSNVTMVAQVSAQVASLASRARQRASRPLIRAELSRLSSATCCRCAQNSARCGPASTNVTSSTASLIGAAADSRSGSPAAPSGRKNAAAWSGVQPSAVADTSSRRTPAVAWRSNARPVTAPASRRPSASRRDARASSSRASRACAGMYPASEMKGQGDGLGGGLAYARTRACCR